jgi:hypothetical protein
MKRIFTALFILFAGPLFAQTYINPKIGISFMNLSDPPPGYDYKGDVGFQMGADFRFGNAFQLIPGLYYNQVATAVKVTGVDTLDIEDNIIRNTLKARVLIGYNFINEDKFKLRVKAGPAFDYLLNSKTADNKIDFDEENFKDGTWSLEAGAGLDLWFLTLDVGYSYGLSNAYKDDVIEVDSKYLGLYVKAGVVIKLSDGQSGN